MVVGLILINSNYISGNNKKIISKGDSAYETNINQFYVSHDGMVVEVQEEQ